MKKQITRPDGTVEVVEGTAEELAEYERNLQETPVKKTGKKRKLLNEETLRAMIAEEIKKVPTTHFHFCGCSHCNQPVMLPSPIWIEPQPWNPALPYYTITAGTPEIKLDTPNADVPATSGYIQTADFLRGIDGNFLVQN